MKEFNPGDKVKRIAEFLWDELDSDTVYTVTEFRPLEGDDWDAGVRIRGGNAWPHFWYTSEYFDLVEDVVTVGQVEKQWDIGETVKPSIPAPVDVVNHPAHYKFDNGVEVIDLTEQLTFNAGNVVKYTARAGRKDPAKALEDLRKAEFYIKREIARVERSETIREA